MNEQQTKQAIINALGDFGKHPLADAATALLGALGYKSQRHIPLSPNTPENFLSQFDQAGRIKPEQAQIQEWESVDFLFQLTGEEIQPSAKTLSLFEGDKRVNNQLIQSYLFFALRLKKPSYSRSELAAITRALNRLFPMPALILFVHGQTLTLSIINRRLHKRDEAKDVLEKVTLIKDIQFAKPHRAHIEILYDLSLEALQQTLGLTNFVELHNAWQKTLDSSQLNKRFYQEVANWYFWACDEAAFPKAAGKDKNTRNAVSLIRLITRLIFVWFVKEKGLIPEDLFDKRKLAELLKPSDPKESAYYKAILQNLFFATLNTEMNTPQKPDSRRFRSKTNQPKGRDQHYMVHNLYRYRDYFKDSSRALEFLSTVPFLNGGLFECLDSFDEENPEKVVRIDGFSDRPDNEIDVPDYLFFSEEKTVDLNEVYGTRNKRYKVRGLINIFESYKFTINENTPIEEEIALDPELLGRVFENLLASYNPETETTARKQTGSFYTPREIVNYMVDESLIFHFENELSTATSDKINERLHHLFAYNDEPHQFSPKEVDALIQAIDNVKILDPACGSGAFPMGILHKLVFILAKLDPRNEKWQQRQIDRVNEAIKAAEQIEDSTFRERTISELEQQIADIHDAFERNELDYGRKLYLIENCIYGVDIQPIACQIAKLRFFISLVVEQKTDPRAENLGIRPLPNLETKFVAANTLIAVDRPGQQDLRNLDIGRKQAELRRVRERYFTARTPATKAKYREKDAKLRAEMAELLKHDGWDTSTAKKLASWDPYDQNASAVFFDPEWMFSLTEGFDVTIGNPPYVRADEQSEWNRRQRMLILTSRQYKTLWEKWDLFVPFIERAYQLLRSGGVTTLIVSDAYCHSKYAQKSQDWFLRNARILRLDFCSDLQIFDAAVHNLIYFFQNGDGAQNQPQRRLHQKEFGNLTMLATGEQAALTYRAFFPDHGEQRGIQVRTVPLDDICYITKGMVVHAEERKARGAFELKDLVAETKDYVHTKAFVEAKHLDRWIPKSQKWLEWGTARAPALFSRPTFSEIYTVPEKLISVDMAAGVEKLRVVYDNRQLFHNHSAWSFVPWHMLSGVRNNSLKKASRYRGEKPLRPDLPKREELEETSRRFSVKYLLGVMNSSAAHDFLRANRRSNIHLYPDDWKKLPIPDVDAAAQAPVVSRVDQILVAKKADPDVDVSAPEAEIDQLVYFLYGLTREEIAILEESLQERTGSREVADDSVREQET